MRATAFKTKVLTLNKKLVSQIGRLKVLAPRVHTRPQTSQPPPKKACSNHRLSKGGCPARNSTATFINDDLIRHSVYIS